MCDIIYNFYLSYSLKLLLFKLLDVCCEKAKLIMDLYKEKYFFETKNIFLKLEDIIWL
jgi:hypothetical protein